MPAVSDYLIPGEKVVLYTRQHLVVLGRAFLLSTGSLALVVWITYISNRNLVLLASVLPILYMLWKAVLRLRRVYVVTDRRVIQQQGLLAVSSVDVSLDMINNVYHEQSLIGRLMRFGNVRLETASEQGIFLFESVPKPRLFKNTILQQRELYRTHFSDRGESESPMNVPKLLEELASLRDRNVITVAEFEEKKKRLLERL